MEREALAALIARIRERLALAEAADLTALCDAAEATARRLRWFEAAHLLLAQEECFVRVDGQGAFVLNMAMPSVREGSPALYVLCSDTFAWACADCEHADYADAEELLRIGVEEGWPGLVRWVQARRHERGEPAEPIYAAAQQITKMDSLRAERDALRAELGQLRAERRRADREALGRIVRGTWIMWARENPVRCERCSGSGWVLPYCGRCSDSGDDHECPSGWPCDDCDGRGTLVRPDWIAPWEEMPEAHREVDRQIGEAVARAVATDEETLRVCLAAMVRQVGGEVRLPLKEVFGGPHGEVWIDMDPARGHVLLRTSGDEDKEDEVGHACPVGYVGNDGEVYCRDCRPSVGVRSEIMDDEPEWWLLACVTCGSGLGEET